MPTYQYACTACAEQLEVVQKFTDDALTECPACAGRLRKVYSAVGVVFKGSGFYRNDSRASANGSGSAAGSNGSKTGEGASAGTSGSGSGDGSGSSAASEGNGSGSGGAASKSAGAAAKPDSSGPATRAAAPSTS